MPFQRDRLFLSIYDACRHRPSAIADATALTDTVISRLFNEFHIEDGAVERNAIVAACSSVLSAFDAAAGVHYVAFHK